MHWRSDFTPLASGPSAATNTHYVVEPVEIPESYADSLNRIDQGDFHMIAPEPQRALLTLLAISTLNCNLGQCGD
jgi:hypothetical protein